MIPPGIYNLFKFQIHNLGKLHHIKSGDTVSLVDTAFIYTWNSQNNEWLLTERRFYMYDCMFRLSNVIVQMNQYGEFDWYNYQRHLNRYSISGNLIEILVQITKVETNGVMKLKK